jgi:hypothetical protein
MAFGFLVFLYGYNVLWLRPQADEQPEPESN